MAMATTGTSASESISDSLHASDATKSSAGPASLLSRLGAPPQLEIMCKRKVRANLPHRIHTFCGHNLSIIGGFVEHSKCLFGAVQHSIIGRFLSIIRSPLIVIGRVCLLACLPVTLGTTKKATRYGRSR